MNNDNNNNKRDYEFLTVEELVPILKLHPSSIQRLFQRGVLPGIKVGMQWRIYRRNFEEYMKIADKS